MPSLKKGALVVSDWVTFELDTDLIDPPVIRLRLRPVLPLAGRNAGPGALWASYMVAAAIDAVAEWDLTDELEGGPVPCDDEHKSRLQNGLRLLFSRTVKGSTDTLAWAVLGYAADERNFLKN
jgi:hypothetical protein